MTLLDPIRESGPTTWLATAVWLAGLLVVGFLIARRHVSRSPDWDEMDQPFLDGVG